MSWRQSYRGSPKIPLTVNTTTPTRTRGTEGGRQYHSCDKWIIYKPHLAWLVTVGWVTTQPQKFQFPSVTAQHFNTGISRTTTYLQTELRVYDQSHKNNAVIFGRSTWLVADSISNTLRYKSNYSILNATKSNNTRLQQTYGLKVIN